MSHLDRKAISTALGAWFTAVTGLEPYDRENSQRWTGNRAHGELFLKVIGSVGVDRRYYEVRGGAPAGEEIVPHVQGARELLWEVRVKSWSQNNDEDAHFYLEKVRNLIRGHSAQSILTGLGLGVQEIRESIDMTYTESGRRVSLAQLDIRFNASIDVEDEPFGYVDTFDVETQWRDADGNLLPAELQFSGEIPS